MVSKAIVLLCKDQNRSPVSSRSKVVSKLNPPFTSKVSKPRIHCTRYHTFPKAHVTSCKMGKRLGPVYTGRNSEPWQARQSIGGVARVVVKCKQSIRDLIRQHRDNKAELPPERAFKTVLKNCDLFFVLFCLAWPVKRSERAKFWEMLQRLHISG